MSQALEYRKESTTIVKEEEHAIRYVNEVHICPLDGSISSFYEIGECHAENLPLQAQNKSWAFQDDRQGEVELWRKWKKGNRPKIQNLQSAQGIGFQTIYTIVDILEKSLVEVYCKIFS